MYTWHLHWNTVEHVDSLHGSLSVYTVTIMLQHHGFVINVMPEASGILSVSHTSKHAMIRFMLTGLLPESVRVDSI